MAVANGERAALVITEAPVQAPRCIMQSGLGPGFGIGRRRLRRRMRFAVARLLAGISTSLGLTSLPKPGTCRRRAHRCASPRHRDPSPPRSLSLWNGGAGAILHEAEIGGAFVLARIVIVAEARAARPTGRSTRHRATTKPVIRPCDD